MMKLDKPAKEFVQGNCPPKAKNRQVRLLGPAQSLRPFNGFRILHGRLFNEFQDLRTERRICRIWILRDIFDEKRFKKATDLGCPLRRITF